MVRRFVTRAALVLALLFILMLLSAPVALADNCSSLSDCLPMTDAQTAVTVAVAVLVAVAIFALPQLLHPPSTDAEMPLDPSAPPEGPGASPDASLPAIGYPLQPNVAHGVPGAPGVRAAEGHYGQGQEAFRGDQAAYTPPAPQGPQGPYHYGEQQGLQAAQPEAPGQYHGVQPEAQSPYAQQPGPEAAHFEAREPGAAYAGEHVQQGPGAEHLLNREQAGAEHLANRSSPEAHGGTQEHLSGHVPPAENKQMNQAPAESAHRSNRPPDESANRSNEPGAGPAAPAGGEPQVGRPESELQILRQGDAPQIARGGEAPQAIPFVPPLEQVPSTTALLGLHHVTASASDPRRNLICYAGLLGLHLVKVTVDFDHPDSYQLYYGDALGNPGTVLSFVCWPNAPRGSRGTGQAISIAFSVPMSTLRFWAEYLTRNGVTIGGPSSRFGDQVLSFFDPDGVQIDLVEHAGAEAREGWPFERIPAECAIRGLHSVSVSVNDYERTATMLQQALDFSKLDQAGSRHRFRAGAGGPGALLDLIHLPSVPEGVNGAGIIQNVGWSTPDEAQQLTWQYALSMKQVKVSQVMDRRYYRSLYTQLPGGAIFDIATDIPGFTVDERPFELGTHLALPPWLEQQRQQIQAALPPLELPGRGRE